MFFESRYRCSSIIRWCKLQRISCVSSCAQRTCPRQILASSNDTRAIKDSSGCLDNHDTLKVGSREQRASVRQRGGERRRAGAMCSVNHKQGLRQARNHCARPTYSNRIAFPATLRRDGRRKYSVLTKRRYLPGHHTRAFAASEIEYNNTKIIEERARRVFRTARL